MQPSVMMIELRLSPETEKTLRDFCDAVQCHIPEALEDANLNPGANSTREMTLDELTASLRAFLNKHGKDAAKQLLAAHNVERVTELRSEQFGDFMIDMEAWGE